MYFGWWHDDWPNSKKLIPNLNNCHDAQFVTISWDLMKEILLKPYCHHERDASFCTPSNTGVRYGSDFGGTSLGPGLRIRQALRFVRVLPKFVTLIEFFLEL